MLVSGQYLDSSCSRKLANVDELTDGLMVVALEALEAAVAAEPADTGATAQRRHFATLVAGAMGVILTGDADLKKAGLRIEKQARKVRNLLEAASQDAQLARAAAADASELAECDACELAALDGLRLEPYVGFYELGSADGAAPAALALAAAAAPAPTPEAAGARLPGWMQRDLDRHGAAGSQAFKEYVDALDRAEPEQEGGVAPEWPTSRSKASDLESYLIGTVSCLVADWAGEREHGELQHEIMELQWKDRDQLEQQVELLQEQLQDHKKARDEMLEDWQAFARDCGREVRGLTDEVSALRAKEQGMLAAFAALNPQQQLP